MPQQSQNLFARFRRSAGDGARSFILTHDGRRITCGDMLDRSAQLAHALRALGVQPGDRVAVQVDKSAEALLLYLACLRTGAVYLPLNAAYTLAELEYFIGDAQPRVFVCAPQKQAAIATLASGLGVAHVETLAGDGLSGSLIGQAAAQPVTFTDHACDGDTLAAILYTSGTTGRSKGAMLTHANLQSNCESLRDAWHYTADDVLLHALPIFHTHGLFVATNVTLAAGAAMILLPRFEPDAVFARLPEASVLMGVPTFYTRLLQDTRLSRASTAHLRLFVSGSAPLLAETHRLWSERTGHAILERYGMTETNMNTSNPYEGDRVPGTVGIPLPGVSLRIADPETGAVLAAGEPGMIELKGPNIFAGYWRMPEKTKAEFRDDGWFITGDIGRIDARGYVQIVGRAKDLIISGGYNVYPKEVEDAIDAVAGVEESAVIGVAHPDFGEGVTAVVVSAKSAAPREADILAQLKQVLAAYKLPKRVLFVDELPRNTMGKVQKNLLRQQFAEIYRGG